MERAAVATWVRVGMMVLAVSQLAIGLWAMIAPHHWYENFPGVHPHLIAAEPPYNAHLATDAGIGFFCTGVGLAVGAAWGRRSGVWVALVTFGAFAIPHAAYHVVHKAPGLTDAEDMREALFLLSAIVFAAVLGWGSTRRPETIATTAAPASLHSGGDQAGA